MVALVFSALWLTACNGCNPKPAPQPPPPPREGQPDLGWCPGSPGCEAAGSAQVFAGAGKRDVTVRKFEIANVHYLNDTNCDPVMEAHFGVSRCGVLKDELDDCGTDGLCPGVPGYTAPDADGTQGDDRRDWFKDCGLDRICPGNIPETDVTNGQDDDGDGAIDDGAYPGPDDGEGDGTFQAAWIAGFSNSRPAMGIHDTVEVRCLALKVKDTTSVVCSLDAVGFFHEEVERARERLKTRAPQLGVDYLAITSSHTHESIDTVGQWGFANPIPTTPGRLLVTRSDGSVIYDHNSFIVDQTVDAAIEAVESLKPATITMAAGHTGADGYLRDSMDPQVMDDTLTIAEARELGTNAPIFTMVHWGNHPEILGGENSLISSDYVGAVRRYLEQGLPAAGTHPAHAGRGGMAIYLQGMVGGLMTQLGVDFTGRDGVNYPANRETLARLEAYGANLAEVAFNALENTSGQAVIQEAELKVKAQSFFMPVANRIFIFAFAAGLFDREVWDETDGQPIDTTVDSLLDRPGSAKTEVFTIDLGAWSMVGIPGEVFPEVAVGGFTGTHAFGRPLVAPDYCRPQSECQASTGRPEDCPVTRPEDGWQNCDCEGCRLCTPPDLTTAPAPPYLKDKMPGAFKTVLGLANDELGYMVPTWLYKVSETAPYFCAAEHHYPETNGPGPQSVPRIDAALTKLFDFSL